MITHLIYRRCSCDQGLDTNTSRRHFHLQTIITETKSSRQTKSVFHQLRKWHVENVGKWHTGWPSKSRKYFFEILENVYLTKYVAMQLRCGGGKILVATLLQVFQQNVPVKKIENRAINLAKIWTKVCGLLFSATRYRIVVSSNQRMFDIHSYNTAMSIYNNNTNQTSSKCKT